MDYSALTERLAIHLESIQEGFEELTRQNSLSTFAKHFSLILSGNFITADVNIFFQKKEKKWIEAHIKNPKSSAALSQLSIKEKFHLFKANDVFPLAFSLPVYDASMFLVLLGPKLDKSEYSEFEKLLLQMFAQMLANAYQTFLQHRKEKELNFSLNQRIIQLNNLVDAGISINRLKKDGSILAHGLEQAVAMTNASRGRISVNHSKRKRYLYFPGGVKSSDFNESNSSLTTQFSFRRTVYSFELADKESRNGIIEFDATDKLLLESLARQVHVALENRELGRQTIEKNRIEQEVAVAGEIQKKLLPDQLPHIEGYDIAGINIPSTEVGGDYYDCIPLDDGRVALIIADVTGHGIAASLLVNSFHSAVYSFLYNDFTLTDLVQKLNKVIYRASPSDKFITALFAILEPGTGEIEYVSAGHNPAYMSRPGEKSVELNSGGIMLGMMGFDIPMQSEKVMLEPGQRFLLYTDGFPEADNRKCEMYGDKTLAAFFDSHAKLSSQKFIETLLQKVYAFAGSAPQGDDMTALYLKRN